MGIFDADLNSLNVELGKLNPSRDIDPNVWKLTVDKDGNGQALIRFLPSSDNKLFVKVKNHFVKNAGGRMFSCMCPKTYSSDADCPVCNTAYTMMNKRLWKTIPEDEQKTIKNYFSSDSYWSVIQVIKDDASPDNNGKIFKFRYGKKILDKIQIVSLDDELEGTLGYNPFHPLEGANFKLIATKVEDWANYDRSAFSARSPWLNGNKKEIEKVYNSNLIDLEPLTTPQTSDISPALNSRFVQWLAALNGTKIEKKTEKYVPSMEDEAFTESVSKPTSVKGDHSMQSMQDNDENSGLDLAYFDSLVEGL